MYSLFPIITVAILIYTQKVFNFYSFNDLDVYLQINTG